MSEPSGSQPLERGFREVRLAAIQGVLDLMPSCSRWPGEGGIEPDAIMPHHNGYSMWFVSIDQLGTAPLSAEEILDRIDARALSSEDAAYAKAEEAEHASDCAVHNEPAYPAGLCDCVASRRARMTEYPPPQSLLNEDYEGAGP